MIQVESVSKVHGSGGGAIRALDDVSFAIAAGERVSLVGPSGSGKSTLLHILAGLDDPTEGSVRLAGCALGELGEKERSRLRLEQVGFVFQSFHLFPGLSAAENVAWPMEIAGAGSTTIRRRVKELLGRLGLGERGSHLPAEMSGGEQQRVAMARALANEPRVVLADEPTGNLDAAAGAQVLDLLEELHEEQRVTLVVVTHDPGVAARAQRVIELRDGHVAHDRAPRRPFRGGVDETRRSERWVSVVHP